MNKVVLVGTIPQEGKDQFYEKFNNRLDVVEAADAKSAAEITDARYLVVRGIQYPREEIQRLPDSVKLLARWGVGFDSVDIAAAGERGITVTICAGGNAEPVAELAVLLMLAAYRKLPQLLARAREGRKDKEDIISKSLLLQNKTVGLLGLGNIGSKVAKIVQSFGAKVQYFDAFRWEEQRERAAKITYTDFDTLLRTSDILSIHVPLMESTKGMIDKEALSIMKRGAILVNTARGPIVNTNDLLEAVNKERIAAAALDTVDGEPLPPEHPIFQCDRILLTPHAGGNTSDNTGNMVSIIANCILNMEHGEAIDKKLVVNSQYLMRAESTM